MSHVGSNRVTQMCAFAVFVTFMSVNNSQLLLLLDIVSVESGLKTIFTARFSRPPVWS